ncbi:hypothetical protein C2S51_011916 [Perilla frutescens var. frutescens]|nr:hypothetical protein C2S51_011916 [Perilla frutescens var. frutescens]
MAMPHLSDRAQNLEKIDKKRNKNSSIRAFIISVFIYISLFYILNLSPSTVVRTTKFWFLLSNTLILIIAADSGAFSCSKNLEFFDEYSSKNNVRYRYSEPTLPPCNFDIKYLSSKHHAQVQVEVEYEQEQPQPPEKIIQVVPVVDHAKPTLHLHEKPLLTDPKNDRDINIKAGKRGETTLEEEEEEEEEFSRMSDEELNTRVEEFIRRVNSQIRFRPAIIPIFPP